MQTEFDAQTGNFYEIRTNASYSNQSIPAGILNTGTWSDLVINYFDNYTWSPAQGDGTGWSYNATGKLTGQKVKELSQANVYRESDYYFDDRDRLVKAFYQNTFSDFNEVTYIYEGLTDDVKTKEIKYKNGSIVTPVKTTYDYDVLGRLTKAKHKINNEAERTLAEYKYDEIGQLIQKRIQPGNYQLIDNIPDVFTRDTPISSTVNDVASTQINLSTNGFTILPGGDYTAEIIEGEEESTTDALQIIDYTYHIRGGLRCINCDVNGVPKLNVEQNDLFALKLDYEDNIGGPVYYNGNIRQQTWISHNNPTQPRIFNYSYDKADRLNSANYSGGIPNTNENYTVSGIGYDKNSNINAMTRQGMTNTTTKTFGTIDQLGYDYHPNTNLLKKITDAVSGNDDVGDFRDAPENPDYDYAPDGSLQVDRNKGITSIVYNELGLPDVVAFTGNKSITYLYDAMGNKLKKTTATSTQTDVIHYDGAVTYFNNQLAYIQHDEGRAINPSLTGGQGTDFVYEYHYLDHLGNLRVAFRQQTAEALRIGATMEPAKAVQEEANFRHVSDTRSGGIAHTGNFSAELKGESGPSKTMRVVAGERITASVFGYLPEPEKEKKKGLVPIPILGLEKIQTEMSTRNHWLLRGGLLVPFTYHKKQNREEAKPNAYLQMVLLDTAGKPVYTERKYLDSIAIGGWKELKIALTPTQNGTLQVSLVNENARVAAYFDDLTITDEPPLIVQENHYDPWGLNLVGIEVTGTPEDLYQFNGGSEKSYSLHDKSYLYETDFRFYDPQSGRFWGVDAMAGEFGGISPMQFGYNNPMSFNDPTGLFSFGPGPGTGVLSGGKGGNSSLLGNTLDFGGGFLKGVRNGAKGLINFATTDIWQAQTWKNTGMLVLGMSLGAGPFGNLRRMQLDREYGTNTFGVTNGFQSAIGNGVNTLMSGTAQQRGDITGQFIFAVAGTKGMGAVASGAGKMATLGFLKTVPKFVKPVSTQLGRLSRSSPSTILGQNLVNSGVIRPANTAAHHIVAATDQLAEPARRILARAGIDINSANNGVFLPQNSRFANPPAITHSVIHSDLYYRTINNRLLRTSNVSQELNLIRNEILNGTFPH